MRRAAIAALCLVCAGCTSAPGRDLFKEGETLYLDARYAEAVALFKQRLLEDPNDAGAHFYVGACYLYDEKNSWLGIAQGEFETALALFERGGKVSPIPRFSAEYFEVICHVNQAKVYLVLMTSLPNDPRLFRGVDAREVVPRILKKCIEQADLAERVSPNHPDVVALRKLVDGVRAEMQRRPPPRATEIAV